MPARALVKIEDIMRLWNHFGESTEPYAINMMSKVRVAAAQSPSGVFLRDVGLSERDPRHEQDQLLEVGSYFAGLGTIFRQMFGEDLKSLSFNTDDVNVFHIIPFRTESTDVRSIDTVFVLYGQNLSFMAFQFERLSIDGWEKLKDTLQ